MERSVRKGDIVKVKGFREDMRVLGRRGNVVQLESTKNPNSCGFVLESYIKKIKR